MVSLLCGIVVWVRSINPSQGTLAYADTFLAGNSKASIEDVHIYNDGGSITVILRGATGDILYVSFDNKMKTDTRFRAYVSAPELIFCQIIPMGSRTERSIIALIQGALDSELSAQEQQDIRENKRVQADWTLNQHQRSRRLVINALDNLESLKREGGRQ
jgi:hypothetical protein